ncbi:hypothetical protein N2152v2_001837 [Parachlorella kessleri]
MLLAFCASYLLYVTCTGGHFSTKKESLIPEQPLGAPESGVAQALSEPATVHGYVAKSGPTKLQYWTPGNRTERHQLFEQWLQAAYGSADPREAGQAVTVTGGMEMRNLPPMYPNCQVLVNHRYKFIYLRHPKSASSSIMTFFSVCAAPTEPQAAAGAAAAQTATGSSAGNASASSEAAAVSSKGQEQQGLGAACLEPLAAQQLSVDEIHRIWREYFVFTVVRNPYQRMLSSYKYLLRKTRAMEECRMVRWDDYCQDPLALGRMCQENPSCCPLPAGFYWHHVIDQGRCLETEEGGWAVDYVATVEKFDEDMEDIIMQINGRRAEGLPPLSEVTGPLGKQNEARGAGAASKVCSEGAAAGEPPQPEQTRVLVPTKGWVAYNATVLLDRYCESADYFSGSHQHCLARAQHFYSTDFSRLYQQQQQPGQQPLAEAR